MRYLIVLLSLLVALPSQAARDFVISSAQYLTAGTSVTAPPFTVSVWINGDNDTTQQSVIAFSANGTTTERWNISIEGAVTNDPIRWNARDGTTESANCPTVDYTPSTTYNVIGVEVSATNRYCCVDGSCGTPNTTARSPDGVDNTIIGGRFQSVAEGFYEGRIWEVAIWTVELTAAEILSLNKGVSPLKIRPESLLSYWPILGRASPEPDIVGKRDATLVADPAQFVQGRMYYLGSPVVGSPTTGGGGGPTLCLPCAANGYRQRRAFFNDKPTEDSVYILTTQVLPVIEYKSNYEIN